MKLRLSRINLLIIGILLILAVTLFVGFGLRKTIVFEIDGARQTLKTRALTVDGAISEAGLKIATRDNITPAKNHLLKNGDRIVIDRARWVYILVDEEVKSLITSEKQIKKILEQVDVPLKTEDDIYLNAGKWDPSVDLPPGTNTLTIQIQRAVPVIISSSGTRQTFLTASSTLLDALWEFGFQLEVSDQLNIPVDSPVKPDLEVNIIQAQPITINTQAGSFIIKSSASKVGQVLAQAGLSLQGLDYSIPNPDSPIPDDNEIQVVRLREEVIIEQTPIQFETEYQPADDLELDTRSTLQPGEYGLIAQRVRVLYQDGVEVSRNIEDTWTAKEPEPRIIGYGTKVVKKIADTPDGPIEYWRALRMYAVSYRPKENDNTTASGLPLQKGIAAIDRRYIPFFTRMYIPGYGEAIAADVGGGVKGRMIDLGYTNEDYESWHQWVTVYFLWPPPDNIVWFIP